MTRRAQVAAFAAICALTTLVNVLASKGGGAPTIADVVPEQIEPFGALLRRMRDPNVNERCRAQRELLEQHQRLVDELLKMAAPEPGVTPQNFGKSWGWAPGPRGLAIEALGCMGTWEAIPLFIRNIDYFEPKTQHIYSPLGPYPCATGLVYRGMPQVLEYLRTTDPADVSDKAIENFAHIFGNAHEQCCGGFEESLNYVRRPTTLNPQSENLQRLRVEMERQYKSGLPE